MKGRVQRCLSWHPRADDGIEEVRVTRPDLLPAAMVDPLHLPSILGACPAPHFSPCLKLQSARVP